MNFHENEQSRKMNKRVALNVGGVRSNISHDTDADDDAEDDVENAFLTKMIINVNIARILVSLAVNNSNCTMIIMVAMMVMLMLMLIADDTDAEDALKGALLTKRFQ